MSEPAVLTDVADGVMTITINRPAAKNAVNKDVAVGIAAALLPLSLTHTLSLFPPIRENLRPGQSLS